MLASSVSAKIIYFVNALAFTMTMESTKSCKVWQIMITFRIVSCVSKLNLQLIPQRVPYCGEPICPPYTIICILKTQPTQTVPFIMGNPLYGIRKLMEYINKSNFPGNFQGRWWCTKRHWKKRRWNTIYLLHNVMAK